MVSGIVLGTAIAVVAVTVVFDDVPVMASVAIVANDCWRHSRSLVAVADSTYCCVVGGGAAIVVAALVVVAVNVDQQLLLLLLKLLWRCCWFCWLSLLLHLSLSIADASANKTIVNYKQFLCVCVYRCCCCCRCCNCCCCCCCRH